MSKNTFNSQIMKASELIVQTLLDNDIKEQIAMNASINVFLAIALDTKTSAKEMESIFYTALEEYVKNMEES